MLNQLDHYYLSLPEPEQSCLLFLRDFILAHDPAISHHFKYSTAFFYYNNKPLCYFSINVKKQLYIGFVNGYKISDPTLVSEGRKQIRVWRIDPEQDIDIKTLKRILQAALVV